MSRRDGMVLYFGLAATAAILFTAFPGIDLWSSGWFYDGGFVAANDPVLHFIYRAVYRVTDALSIGLILLLIAVLALRRKILGLDRAAIVFLMVALAVGPGIVVNSVLKDHWGRARPSQVEMFGGGKQFTPALEASDQCERNCSFPSGHPSVGFYVMSFGLLLAGWRRRVVMAGGLAAGALLGLMRMAQGAHFLSDVVFAGLIVFGVSWLSHYLIVERGGLGATPGWRRIFWIGAICAIVAVLSFLLYDRAEAMWMRGVDPGIRDVFDFITQFGLGKGWLIGSGVAAIVLFLWARFGAAEPLKVRLNRNAARAAFIFASVAASGLLVDLIKVIVGRARPKLLFRDQLYGFTWHGGAGADYWSFPSGHCATAAAMATTLTLLWPRWWPIYWLGALLIFASRLVITAHYPSDVIGGAFIGVATVWAIRAGFERARLPLSAP